MSSDPSVTSPRTERYRMKRNIFYMMSLVIAGGALAGCDTEETSCTALTAQADCAGYACLIDEGAVTGLCATTPAEGCATGFEAGTDEDGAAACVPIAGADSCDDINCGAYSCDDTSGIAVCATACTDGSECAEDAQCQDDGTCLAITEQPYLYVAVVSRSSEIENQNPGPDLDAIYYTSGGTNTFPTGVISSNQGAEDAGEGNTRPISDSASAILAQDTVGTTADSCDLDAEPGYVCIGGEGGFIVAEFAAEFATGDTVTVVEVNSVNCEPAETERADAYEVFVTSDATAAAAAASVSDVEGWCSLGSPTDSTGGTFNVVFDSANCGM